MPIVYDPKRSFYMLLRWRGTIFEFVAFNPWFWILLLFNFTLTLLRSLDIISVLDLPEIPSKFITLIGGLLTFALVFWMNAAFSRFFGQVDRMIACGGSIINITTLAVSSMRWVAPEKKALAAKRCEQLARYGNLAYHSCYYTIARYDNWEYLLEKQLITRYEMDMMQKFKGRRSNLACAWMLDVVALAHEEGLLKHPKKLSELVFDLRSNAIMLQDYCNYPVPLGYYHFLTLLLNVWLFFTAYESVFYGYSGYKDGMLYPLDPLTATVSVLCYALLSIAFFGIAACAQTLVFPWGKHETDIDVITQLDNISRMSKQLLNQSEYHPRLTDDSLCVANFASHPAQPPPPPKTYEPAVAKAFNRWNIMKCGVGRPTELEEVMRKRHNAEQAWKSDETAPILVDVPCAVDEMPLQDRTDKYMEEKSGNGASNGRTRPPDSENCKDV